jgi:hypothetical protein
VVNRKGWRHQALFSNTALAHRKETVPARLTRCGMIQVVQVIHGWSGLGSMEGTKRNVTEQFALGLEDYFNFRGLRIRVDQPVIYRLVGQ